AELAACREPEEAELARAATGSVEAHLALHDLGFTLGAEPHPGAHAAGVNGARLRHVDGPHPLAGRAVAEVEIFAVHEVARIEAAEVAEEVSPDRHERAVDPIDAVRRTAPPRGEAADRRVEQQVAQRAEARRRRLPASVRVHQPAAGDSGPRREEE